MLTIITNTEALKMRVETKNFNPDSDVKLICTCGHHLCDKRSVRQVVLDRVQRLREEIGRPLTITSGGRCIHHPNEIHRTKPADHQKGIAVDISVSGGVARDELVRLGIKHGFNAIGIAKTFVHLGYRHGEQSVMWVY